ncbi:MAG: cytochrome c4 [Gammaproteobacteria bacterium]|nr:cytochrome c4 [Gammaproteobacteria bacterium]NIR84608.1 cytochrome c4 [Gammaproteobacteria bacterium]NIR90511.1 cytochrome c4 [Gammaproteobacteria bacterium]NIU05659.1 cytochrome c4 [Gammaproteobacteria bacterium]NIV52798.1 c-type cytochrome [Gammaproteobacteria bacterium]
MKNVALTLCVALVLSPAAADAAGDAEAGKSKSQVCAACHGADGNSASAQWPKLAQQHASYTTKQLMDFKEGEERMNQVMAGMVANLSPQDMDDLAAYYARQSRRGGYADNDSVELGQKIYRAGNAQSGLPACMSCHGPTGSGNPLAVYPSLWGQHAQYTATQLRAFRSGERRNDPNAMMRDVAKQMTDDEIEAVSQYIAGLYAQWPE